jgi:hypothetical protein
VIDETDKAIVVVIDRSAAYEKDMDLMENVKLFVNGREYEDFGDFTLRVDSNGYSLDFSFRRRDLPEMRVPRTGDW